MLVILRPHSMQHFSTRNVRPWYFMTRLSHFYCASRLIERLRRLRWFWSEVAWIKCSLCCAFVMGILGKRVSEFILWLSQRWSRYAAYETKSTVLVLRMAHRKWKETKQQPNMLPGPAVPGCRLVCFHILWAILSTIPVKPASLFWVGDGVEG